jgi:hypothetical protein
MRRSHHASSSFPPGRRRRGRADPGARRARGRRRGRGSLRPNAFVRGRRWHRHRDRRASRNGQGSRTALAPWSPRNSTPIGHGARRAGDLIPLRRSVAGGSAVSALVEPQTGRCRRPRDARCRCGALERPRRHTPGHHATRGRLVYGDLVEDAARLPVLDDVRLKVGRSSGSSARATEPDHPAVVAGRIAFSMDAAPAALRRRGTGAGLRRGSAARQDDTKARAVPAFAPAPSRGRDPGFGRITTAANGVAGSPIRPGSFAAGRRW